MTVEIGDLHGILEDEPDEGRWRRWLLVVFLAGLLAGVVATVLWSVFIGLPV